MGSMVGLRMQFAPVTLLGVYRLKGLQGLRAGDFR